MTIDRGNFLCRTMQTGRRGGGIIGNVSYGVTINEGTIDRGQLYILDTFCLGPGSM